MKLKYYLRGLGIGMVVTALIMGIVTGEQGALTDAEIKAAALKLGMVESESLKLSDLPQGTAKPGGGSTGGGSTEESEGSSEESKEPEVSDGESAESSEKSKESESSEEESAESAEESKEPEVSDEEDAEASKEESAEASEESESAEASEESKEPEASDSESAESAEESKEPESSDGESTEISGTVTFTVRSGSGSRTVCDRLEEAGLITDAAAFDSYLCNNGYSKRIGAGTFEIPTGASEAEIAKILTRPK